MRPIGFSTGALAYADFRRALRMMEGHSCECVELSALREDELKPLIDALDSLDLTPFRYVSFHAPSRREFLSEPQLASLLHEVAERGMPIVMHPDVILDYGYWREFGRRLCVENMDKRKPIGRTAQELDAIFQQLPDATLCFDIGHARQVDPTMSQAAQILTDFRSRLVQLHVSEVNTLSRHEPLNMAVSRAFSKIASSIPEWVPVLLETPVHTDAEIEAQINQARRALEPRGSRMLAFG